MSRNRLDELSDINAVGTFITGNTVTITVYDLSDSSVVTLDSNSCLEIGSTGTFKWPFSNITTAPTSIIQYFYEMTNGSQIQREIEFFGGWTELLGITILDPDLCVIIAEVSQPSGCLADLDQFCSSISESYAELQGTYFQISSSRFFTTDKTFPNYEDGTLKFTLPRLASFKIVIPVLGIDTTISVPDSESANLNDLI